MKKDPKKIRLLYFTCFFILILTDCWTSGPEECYFECQQSETWNIIFNLSKCIYQKCISPSWIFRLHHGWPL